MGHFRRSRLRFLAKGGSFGLDGLYFGRSLLGSLFRCRGLLGSGLRSLRLGFDNGLLSGICKTSGVRRFFCAGLRVAGLATFALFTSTFFALTVGFGLATLSRVRFGVLPIFRFPAALGLDFLRISAVLATDLFFFEAFKSNSEDQGKVYFLPWQITLFFVAE